MASATDTVQAAPRATGKKGAARKLRMRNELPVVVYGPATAARSLRVNTKALLESLETHGTSHIYDVAIEGESSPIKVLVKDLQRDPVSRRPLHMDFYAVDMTRPIRVEVRLKLDGKPVGVTLGNGLLSQVLRSTEIQCLPDRIPSQVVADVSQLNVGETLHLSDIQLPEGVRFTSQGDEAVASVVAPDAAEDAAPAQATADEGSEAAASEQAPEGASESK